MPFKVFCFNTYLCVKVNYLCSRLCKQTPVFHLACRTVIMTIIENRLQSCNSTCVRSFFSTTHFLCSVTRVWPVVHSSLYKVSAAPPFPSLRDWDWVASPVLMSDQWRQENRVRAARWMADRPRWSSCREKVGAATSCCSSSGWEIRCYHSWRCLLRSSG